MSRPKAPCGSYPAYRRHLREHEEVDSACREAPVEHGRTRPTSAPARLPRQTAAKAEAPPPEPPKPMEPDSEGHISRLEVLRELLEASRTTLPVLQANDPARAYLQMRE